jgi:hypothetical protein
MGKTKNSYKIWLVEPDRKRPLRIRRWDDNIMYLWDTVWGSDLAHDTDRYSFCEHDNESSSSVKGEQFFD